MAIRLRHGKKALRATVIKTVKIDFCNKCSFLNLNDQ